MQGFQALIILTLVVTNVSAKQSRREETNRTTTAEYLNVSGYQRLSAWTYTTADTQFANVGFLQSSDSYDRIDGYAAACGKACQQFGGCLGVAFSYSYENSQLNNCMMVGSVEVLRELELWDETEKEALQVFIEDPARFCGPNDQYFGLSLYLDNHEVIDSLTCRPRLVEGDICALYTDFTYHNGGCGPDLTCGITEDIVSSHCVKNADSDNIILQINSPNRVTNTAGTGQVSGYTLPHPSVLTLTTYDYDNSFPVSDLHGSNAYATASAYVSACSEQCNGREDCMGIAYRFKSQDSEKNSCRLFVDGETQYNFIGCGANEGEGMALRALFKLRYTCNTEGQFYGYLYQGEQCEVIIQNYGCQETIHEGETCSASDETDAVMVDFSNHNSGCEVGTSCRRTEDENDVSPARCRSLVVSDSR
ncbi:hypothetical protein SARC_02446 [Sphaeroforma arctica JP610]|uniref:Apple domain-containing protein n=1 Tax=Sphaeroforma arctica JP610 TaxID=667725 RepID=A0A0L0G8W8_9EUKA|nr:hypothetical protein SARC_02446 [Sphaeroforma arctica JP610]KNC85354.1 hypothetical protein SARC_02446 [Sphaeroforma arctica JP610]|eukprot:XP_014159256.1 hypothetical protein SARC_02446 [Sphaeroforma arctica JP610]